MPAILDDPTSPIIYRQSGIQPYPDNHTRLPSGITFRHVTLRDGITKATFVPYASVDHIPVRLVDYLSDLVNKEIEAGDSYPMIDPIPRASFGPFWFGNFGSVLLAGEYQSYEDVKTADAQGNDWEKECLGTFYIKPNYVGRSSHVCNGGFLVTIAARGQGVGRLMGEAYLRMAPRLGFIYSVFNLVYESNVASMRIWDNLGFQRIGRVKGCGNLKSSPDKLVDAIVYGRDLSIDEFKDG